MVPQMKRHMLHLAVHPTAQSRKIGAALANSNIEVVPAEDCYTALATIVRSGANEFECVIAGLSGLSRSDREFFQLVSRRFRTLPVYVYGDSPQGLTKEAAAESGARELTDSAMWNELNSPSAPTPEKAPPPAKPAASRKERTVRRTRQLPLPIEQVSSETESDVVLSDESLAHCDQDSEAELLSRRDQEGPVRRQPNPPINRPAFSRMEPPVASVLLSEEELAALLGDDFHWEAAPSRETEEPRGG